MADTAKSADVARRLALTEARAVEAERQAAAKDAMLIEKERELVRVAGVRNSGPLRLCVWFECVCLCVCVCVRVCVCVCAVCVCSVCRECVWCLS